MKTYELGLSELSTLVDEVLENFPAGVVILQGDLAAGKTTLVQSMVKELKIEDDVTSPTFSLQQCYGDKVFHYDMYNHGLEHFISLGMLEELDKEGLHFVEWGNDELLKILRNAGMEVITINISKMTQNKREYRVDYA